MWEDAQADFEAEMARDAEYEAKSASDEYFDDAPYYQRPEYYSMECSALGHDN